MFSYSPIIVNVTSKRRKWKWTAPHIWPHRRRNKARLSRVARLHSLVDRRTVPWSDRCRRQTTSPCFPPPLHCIEEYKKKKLHNIDLIYTLIKARMCARIIEEFDQKLKKPTRDWCKSHWIVFVLRHWSLQKPQIEKPSNNKHSSSSEWRLLLTTWCWSYDWNFRLTLASFFHILDFYTERNKRLSLSCHRCWNSLERRKEGEAKQLSKRSDKEKEKSWLEMFNNRAPGLTNLIPFSSLYNVLTFKWDASLSLQV